jgi:hypothetical protein
MLAISASQRRPQSASHEVHVGFARRSGLEKRLARRRKEARLQAHTDDGDSR